MKNVHITTRRDNLGQTIFEIREKGTNYICRTVDSNKETAQDIAERIDANWNKESEF